LDSEKRNSSIVGHVIKKSNFERARKRSIGKAHRLSISFVVILALLIPFLHPIALASSYTDVTVSEAKSMIDSNLSLVILDVRNQSEYDSGHIGNAKLIPLYQLGERLDELNKDDEILVYCKKGGRSTAASQFLVDNGFLHVYNMPAGIIAWMNVSFPVYVKYPSIQEAIKNASDGGSIYVSSGVYNERLVINKTVNMFGENSETTIVDGNGTNTVISIGMPNVNITKFTVENATWGFYLNRSANYCSISNCRIENNSLGIFMKSDENLVRGNLIANNSGSGIEMYASCSCSPVWGNTVEENNFLNNGYGVQLYQTTLCKFYHNNFINNTHQVLCSAGNEWDDAYPSGGNYWSDYNGTDFYYGQDQNETGNDGIGDTRYTVFDGYKDRYPLMGPTTFFDVGIWDEVQCYVAVVSNSTVSKFHLNETEKIISFNATHENSVVFCRVTIPNIIVQDLWQGDYKVLIDGKQPIDERNWTYGANTYLYFMYQSPEHEVIIVPEFASLLIILTVFIALTSLAVIDYRNNIVFAKKGKGKT
jgi:parallel beta-helix repeat protein